MRISRYGVRRLAAVVMVALALGSAQTARPAAAHEAKCPVCKLDVVQDTEALDHEVALKFGRKRIEYRCVRCALSDAKSYRGDVTILAPSELKGKPVLLSRKDGAWSVLPEGAVFAGQQTHHARCNVGFRALSTRTAFDKWSQQHPDLLKDAQPLSLAQMLELAK